LRLEEGFTQGSQIGVFYDPLIAKLVVHGRDRTEALRMLRKALEEYQVVGVSTNIEFLRTLAGCPSFIDGDVETGFIEVCDPTFNLDKLLNKDRNIGKNFSRS
jgi:3-methylcrotonyl-CoA carboxylase alpha subunit